jgi:hypothetical protein
MIIKSELNQISIYRFLASQNQGNEVDESLIILRARGVRLQVEISGICESGILKTIGRIYQLRLDCRGPFL